MENKELIIEGMHCDGCKRRIENIVGSEKGVEEIKVDLDKKIANVKYDKSTTDISKIIEIIEDAGFKAVEKV